MYAKTKTFVNTVQMNSNIEMDVSDSNFISKNYGCICTLPNPQSEAERANQVTLIKFLNNKSLPLKDSPIDAKGNQIPPPEAERIPLERNPQVWKIKDLVEKFAVYNRKPQGHSEISQGLYNKIMQNVPLTSKERETYNNSDVIAKTAKRMLKYVSEWGGGHG